MANDAVVEFNRIEKTYRVGLLRRRRIPALRGVTLKIPKGSIYGLLGPNRAGKTTLVKLLLSICRPTGGRLLRFGRPGWDRNTLARVGYLHESLAFPRYLTALELMNFYGSLSGVPRTVLGPRAAALLERVGLSDRTREPIGGFSKGMLQRLALAQSLVNEPELLVLDEPSEGMDLLARQMLHDVLDERRAQGRTSLLVSHNLRDVEELCDRVAVLRAGLLTFEGPLDRLTAAAASPGHLEEALEPLYAGASA